jgi:MAE_28990/MAE_18760-like HEPN
MNNWSQELENDLRWREAELGSLRLEALKNDKGSVIYQALLRALWAMLYAHYEGFCKFAWDLYLDELQKLGIKRKDCREEIAKLSLQKYLNSFKWDLSIDSFWEFGQTGFQKMLEEDLDFSTKLDTESNLYPNLLKKNSIQVCLNYQLVEKHETKLKALVKRRNEIAHGKPMVIKDLQEYQKYEDAAIEVMHELAISIVDCLDNKSYLKNP